MSSSRTFAARALRVATFFTVSSLAALAGATLTGASGQKVAFHATTTNGGGLKVDGTTSDLSVKDDGTTVTLAVKLDTIATGIGTRDKHTKETVKAEENPTVTLKVARSALKFPEGDAEVKGSAKGKFTLAGQTHDVAFNYTVKKDGAALAVHGDFTFNYTDYGIEEKKYLMIKVNPEVKVEAEFHVLDK